MERQARCHDAEYLICSRVDQHPQTCGRNPETQIGCIELIAGSALVNAYLLHQEITNNKMSITQFREEVTVGKLYHQKPNKNFSGQEKSFMFDRK
jgi:hypothetical protein